MMKPLIRKKQFAALCGVVLMTVCLLAGCTRTSTSEEKTEVRDFSQEDVRSLPVKTMEASYAWNVSDKRVAVGASDYVFTGKVLSSDGTVYEDLVPMEDQDGNQIEVGNPYTRFTVQVKENMKGTLRTEKPIKIVKDGGVAQDGKALCLYENDGLPEVDKTYIFLAFAQEDGSLLISGPNSNVPLEKNADSDSYKQYKAAIKEEIVPEGYQRNVSVYDAR